MSRHCDSSPPPHVSVGSGSDLSSAPDLNTDIRSFAAERTSRQRTLPQVGDSGQRKLDEAVVVVIGAGGLGAPVIQYLAAAGVGTIHVFDDDVVELSNLNRQVIHSAHQLGTPKVDHAVSTAARIAPEVRLVPHQIRLTPENVVDQLGAIHAGSAQNGTGIDAIIDGSDSFNTRFTVQHGARAWGLPVIFGAIMQWSAQITLFWSAPPADQGEPIVLTDVFPDTAATRATPGCAETGVMGAVTGIVGSLLATETLKFLLGVGTTLLGRMLIVDALDTSITELPLNTSAPQNRAPSVAASDATGSPKTESVVPSITVEHAARHCEKYVWVDVRRRGETTQLPGPDHARSIPLDELLRLDATAFSQRLHRQENIDDHDDDAALPVLFFCASGPRSLTAARRIRELGISVAGYLDGGMTAWAARHTQTRPAGTRG